MRPVLGFTTFRCASALIAGIETMRMIRKGQLDASENQPNPSQASPAASQPASQLHSLAFFLSSGRLNGLHSLIAFATELEIQLERPELIMTGRVTFCEAR